MAGEGRPAEPDSSRRRPSPGPSPPDRSGAGVVLSRRDRLWIVAAGALTTAFAAILSAEVFGRIPHVQDSVAQLFQARIFAEGRLFAVSPPLREFFDYAHMINDGRWYSQYPPGHSLLLVSGLLLGAPWLVNPVLAGLAIVALGLLAGELYGGGIARIAVLLGLFSPFLVVMASSFMSHVSGLALLTLFLLFYFRTLRTGARRDAVLGAICLAWAVLVRPYTAAAMSLPVFLHWLWNWSGAARRGPVLVLFLGGAAGALLLALYQWGTTGDPLLPGYIKLYGPSHGLGFGKGTWGPPHTLARGLGGAWGSLKDLNIRLFAWPLTSLWPLALALLPVSPRDGQARGRATAGAGRSRPAGSLALLFLLPAALLLAYVFYWYHDYCFGPRYLYEALGPILILSALGLDRLDRLLGSALGRRGGRTVSGLVVLIVGLLLFSYAWTVRWPSYFRLPPQAEGQPPTSPVRQASYFQRYSREYWGVSPHLGEEVRQAGLSNALVFTRFSEPKFDFLPMRYLWFGSAFAHERPDLARAPVIFARDLGDRNASLIRAFPGREVYLYVGTIEDGRLERVILSGQASGRTPQLQPD